MLKLPPQNIYQRYLHLLAMAERGTEHEVTVAKEKIERLKKRYALNAVPVADEGELGEDLFAAAANVRPDPNEMRSLVIFEMKDTLIGNYVKWVLSEGFKINGVWRHIDGSQSTELFVGAKEEDLTHLRQIAHVVTERFQSLWEHFRKSIGADPDDQTSFYLGLYDGLMRETRKPGRAMPGRTPQRKRGRAKKLPKSATSEAVIRPHAYSVALDLGRQIRLNRSLDQITSFLDDLVSVPPQESPSTPTPSPVVL